MKVRFYKTTKRVNSTAIPTNYVEYDCQLKDVCAITSPQIKLTVFTDYNYCYIPNFNRYYFVTGCVIESHGIYTYTLAVDVLATYRSQILGSTTFVKRSASNFDLNLVDDTWLHDTTFTESVVTSANSGLSTQGCYLLTVVNKTASNSANPASTMYALGESAIALLLSNMFDLENYDDLTDLEATYFNPFQYITSCKWIPIGIGSISGSGGPVHYGWFDKGNVNGTIVQEYGKTLTWSITLPSGNDWTWKNSEWTHHLLYVPFCGEVEIDPIYSGKTLTITMYIDFNTGGCVAVITDGANQIISSLNGKAGADVAISQVAGELNIPTSTGELVEMGLKTVGSSIAKDKSSWLTFGSNLLNTLGQSTALGYGQITADEYLKSTSLDGGSDVAKSFADGLSNQILKPTVSKSGSDGARYSIMQRNTMILYTRHYTRYVDVHNFIGGMCCQNVQLSTLSGYTQVANGMLSLNALDEEKTAIRQMLESGFYIE